MKKTFLAAAFALGVAIPAHAGVSTYACHRLDDFKLYAAKVDFSKKTITWDEVVYRNMKQVTSDCAKACFEATSRSGTARLDTATQGVASLTVTFGGPRNDGVDEAECDLVR